MGGGDGRAETVDFRQLLGRSSFIDHFGGGGAAVGHHHDGTGFEAGAYHRVFFVYVVVGHYYAGVVFAAAGS